MSEVKKKKTWWFSKIESREDALKVIKGTSIWFFFIATLNLAFAFWMGFYSSTLSTTVYLDAAIGATYMVGGLFLRLYSSRTVAVFLVIFAAIMAFFVFAFKSNVPLALIILWAAIRAVVATFKLHGRFRSDTLASNAPRT